MLLLLALAAPQLRPATANGKTGAIPPANVLVARARTEPALAIDPRAPNRLIMAANPDYFHLRAHERLNDAFITHDGGVTWTEINAPTYGAFTGVADPSLAVDTTGRAYYLFMGETPSFCGETGNVALTLARIPAGGGAFGLPTAVDINSSDDKPYMAVRSGATPTIFVGFTRWTAPYKQILITHSINGGHAFAPPTVLYASSGVNMGALPVPGPGHRLYVLWAHYSSEALSGPLNATIFLRVSNDDGRTFGPLVTVASFTALPRQLIPGSLRIFTFPTAAVDPASGTLYVAWTQARTMPHPRYAGQMQADLMLTRSRDGGQTFAPAVRLNDTPLGDRFMPTLAVSPSGMVYVAFYDRRADGVRFGLYGVAALDQGASVQVWPNVRLSATLSSPYVLHYIVPGSTCVAPGRFMGDYITGVAAPDGAFDVAWDDTALGVYQETDLWFSRVPPAYLRAGMPRDVPW